MNIADRRKAWNKATNRIFQEHAIGEDLDAGFDGGEWSGPCHDRILQKRLDHIARQLGLADAEQAFRLFEPDVYYAHIDAQ